MKAITQGAYNLQQQGADSIQPLSPQGHCCRYLEKKNRQLIKCCRFQMIQTSQGLRCYGFTIKILELWLLHKESSPSVQLWESSLANTSLLRQTCRVTWMLICCRTETRLREGRHAFSLWWIDSYWPRAAEQKLYYWIMFWKCHWSKAFVQFPDSFL